MCGIAGLVSLNKDDTFDKKDKISAVSILYDLQNRGTHAWGTYIEKDKHNSHQDCGMQDDTLPGEIWKMPLSVKHFIRKRKGKIYLDDVNTFLMHTRSTTQGDASVNINNHPFNTPNFILAHNGGVSNDAHILQKHKLKTDIECDSYVIIALIQKFYDNDKNKSVPKAIEKAMSELEGGMACWLYHKDTKELYLFRNRNPIEYYIDDVNKRFVFASTSRMITKCYSKKSVYSCDITSLPAFTVFKLDGEELKEVGNFKTKTSTSVITSNRNFSSHHKSQDLSNIDKYLEDLFELFNIYDKGKDTYQSIISILRNEVYIMIRSVPLINLLDKTNFKKHKEDKKYKSEWTKYRVTPIESISGLTHDLMKATKATGKKEKKVKKDTMLKEIIEGCEELAETLGSEFEYLDKYFYFSYASSGSIPVEAKRVFAETGFTFGDTKIKFKDNDNHRKQIVKILKRMDLIV